MKNYFDSLETKFIIRVSIAMLITGGACIYHAFADGDFSILLFLIGLAFVLPIAFYLIKTFHENSSSKQDTSKEIERLKRVGKRIDLDFDHTTIKTNSWSTEVIESSDGAIHFGSPSTSYHKTEIHSIVFTFDFQGKSMTQAINVALDLANLRIKMGMARKTSLYIDPKNHTKKIIDISFLMSDEDRTKEAYTIF